MEEEVEKKVWGPLEKIVLLLVIGLLGYISLNYEACGIVERTEQIEFIEPPSNKTGDRPKRPRSVPKSKEVDHALQSIATALGQGKNWDNAQSNALSKDEKEYLKTKQQKYQLDDKIKSAKDWFYLLKTSHDTYQQVKGLFDRVASKPNEQESSSSYESIFLDPQQSDYLFQELQSVFDLSPEQARKYAGEGHYELKDWVELLDTTLNRVSDGQ